MVDNSILTKLDKDLQVIRKEKDPALVKKIEGILDMGDPKDFCLIMASGRGHYKQRLVGSPEVKFLIEHPEISLPLIYKRLVSNKWEGTERMLSVYFIVLEKTKNPESLPYLIDYLSTLPPEFREYVEQPPNPFCFAVDAVLEFTGPTKEIPFDDLEYRTERGWSNRIAFDNRLKLANDAKEWLSKR